MTKSELRDKYRALRLKMDARDAEKASLEICRRLYWEIDWSKMRKICSYEPIAELREVNVRPMLETVKYKSPGIQITLIGMSKGSKIPKTKFDMIIVPVLAFDKYNYRLGWGGGWYDRFLAQQPQAMKIGAAFQNGFVNKGLPHDPHDVHLDRIITEGKSTAKKAVRM